MIPVRLVSIAILVLLTSGTLTAQNAPNPLGQPLLDASGDVRDDAFIQIPLRADDRRYADIDGDRLKSFLMEVDSISLADRDRGNVFWGRNIGTLGHEETQDWVERYFRANGLENVYRQPFDVGPQWKPEAWTISFSAGGRTFELESARPPQGAESTPAGGLDFELIWLGTGSEADYIGRDVRGKAVLILDIPRPGTLHIRLERRGRLPELSSKVLLRSESCMGSRTTSPSGNGPQAGRASTSGTRTA